MIYITIIASFILESVFTNFITTDLSNISFFMPFFTIISIILIGSYTKNNNSYYLIAFLTGLIYDIAYTDTLLLNAIIFLTIAIITSMFNRHFNQSVIFNVFLSFGLLIYYQTITLALLSITGNAGFHILTITMIFITSISANIIYCIILHFILKKASQHSWIKPRH